jgi:hypothetical protein
VRYSSTGDKDKRARLLSTYDALPKEHVLVRGGIWGKFTWGQIRWGTVNQEVITSGRGKLTDALLAATASGEADVLVTEDTSLRNKMDASTTLKCKAWWFADFEAFVRRH